MSVQDVFNFEKRGLKSILGKLNFLWKTGCDFFNLKKSNQNLTLI